MVNLNAILDQFVSDCKIAPYGDGHINDTYLTSSRQFILQRINTKIFKDYEQLMNNIDGVTSFLKEKIKAAGGNPERETLTVIKTKDGKNYYKTEDGDVYRLYIYIDNSVARSVVTDPVQLYHAGKAFGKFQFMLADYPAENLFEVIPDFHNTRKRFEALKEAIENDIAGRKHLVEKEIEFALSQEHYIDTVVDGLASGELPLRVTHNDTKINNVLFDKDTEEGLCVIDLDTVMPGSLLYDFGDALRAGATTGAEDETDLSKVWFDMYAFKNFAKGFLEYTNASMTDKEAELLPLSAKLLTYECGIRFLTDYLNGDTYFKIHREHHNLDRARNQFKLVEDMTNKEAEMMSIINQLRRK